jgi:hypothetical protein
MFVAAYPSSVRSLPSHLWLGKLNLIFRRWATLGLLLPWLATGCGEPGSPQPPSLNLPVPVTNLAASRIGDTVHLTWITTDKTTDHTTPTGPVIARICRIQGSGPCEYVADEKKRLGIAASFDDLLPTTITAGKRELLTYYVELDNHARKSAGRSNPAYTAGGPAPAPLSGLTATPRAEGVVLHWDAAQGTDCSVCKVRIERLLQGAAVAKPAKSSRRPGPMAAPEPSPRQMLEVAAPQGSPFNQAADITITFGETYSYRVRRIDSIQLDGHRLEVLGQQSSPVTIETRDTFPPAVPRDLAVVADDPSKAIDLSWSPDSEPDLAGYVVYRRDAAGNAEPRRVSGPNPLPEPAFHDTQVQSGGRYAYSVSAVDQSGNESTRSPESEETLSPAQ